MNTSPAGDVNGDGLADILIGIEGGGESNHGVVYVVPGMQGLAGSITLREAPAPGDGITRYFGPAPYVQAARVCPAGDINRDGFDDFVIASQPDQATLPVTPWRLLVALGGPALPPRIEFTNPGPFGFHIPGREGLAIVGLPSREPGDLNSDGYPDLAFAEGATINRPPRVHVVLSPFGGVKFVRGDANFDGAVEISDAVFILGYLFLGGESPRCADAADVDDSGELNVTDAIFLLSHLFLGGVEPAEPYAKRGRDGTVDRLECRGF